MKIDPKKLVAALIESRDRYLKTANKSASEELEALAIAYHTAALTIAALAEAVERAAGIVPGEEPK